MPLYNHGNESKRQNASAAALQGVSTNNIHNSNNNIDIHGAQRLQQQHQQPASPFPEELLSMRLPQALLNKYVMDTESFRHGKGFWGIGRYSWTITVQARSNGKKQYVIKRVAKSLLPPEAYYRYPTTAHRLCTCPACKSRREQLLQSGQLDPKDVEEVLALHYNGNSNSTGAGSHGNNNTSGSNGSHAREHRRENSQQPTGVARPSQPSSPSASSSNLNLLGLGAMVTTLATSNKKEKRGSGGSILPLQRVNSMSPTRLFARAGSGGVGGSGRKSNASTPQGTPAHSRPPTPMMTPLSRPGSPSVPSLLPNAHKSSHTSQNTPNHPNNNHNANQNNSSSGVVSITTPNFHASNIHHQHHSSEGAILKHLRSKSHQAIAGGSLRLSSSSTSHHHPQALSMFGRALSQDRMAQTTKTSGSPTLLSPTSPSHPRRVDSEIESKLGWSTSTAMAQQQLLTSPPPSQRLSVDKPTVRQTPMSLQQKGLTSIQSGRLFDMRASASTTAIHTAGGVGRASRGTGSPLAESPSSVLLPSLVLDPDDRPSHPSRSLFLHGSTFTSRGGGGGGGGGALKKKEGRPKLRRCASTPSLSRARTGLDALDEDPLVTQLRAAARYPMSKMAITTQKAWRELIGVPKVEVTLIEETAISSSSSSSSLSRNGRRSGGDQAGTDTGGDGSIKENSGDDEEEGRIFCLEDDHEASTQQRHQHIAVDFDEEGGDESDEENDDSESEESADEAWIAPGCPQEEPQSPVRSPAPSAAATAAAAAAVFAGLSLTPSTSISIQQPNYVPPPHSLPMELVLLQTYNDSDHLPEHHEWTQDQDYWYYVTKAHGVKRPKLKKISSWWSEALGGGGGGFANIGAGSGAGPAGPISLLLTASSPSTSSTHALSSEPIATGPIYNMSMPPAGTAPSKHGNVQQRTITVNGSSLVTTTAAVAATTTMTTALTTNGHGGDGDHRSSNGHGHSNSLGNNLGGRSDNSSKSSSNNMLAVPMMNEPKSNQEGNGERFLNVHGLASDVSLISLDSNGYVYNNYSTTPTATASPLNKSMAAWTKRRHGSPRNSKHSSKYYYVDWDEYLSL
ncbi:hypothetical protein BGZ73_000618 [Actinomortierella ambigua]|nr:hypothetical protein BGZ73_000618 [Actinomortierella ambigua]